MRATVMYGAGDVRIQDVPDAKLIDPTDAVVRITRACICGSDLWPYQQMEPTDHGQRMGHEFIGLIEDVGSEVRSLKRGDLVVAPFRAYIEELLPDVLEGRVEPGRVLDRTGSLEDVPNGYRLMNDRDSIKFQISL